MTPNPTSITLLTNPTEPATPDMASHDEICKWLQETAWDLARVYDWTQACHDQQPLTWDAACDLDSAISKAWDETKALADLIDQIKKESV